MPTLLERHRRVLPSWVSLYYREPIALDRGEGCWVWDRDGRRYLDFFGGILTTISGHAVPEIVRAVQEQAAKLLHSSTVYLIESQVELAERIAELSGITDAKVFFTNSGTEANDAALMLATAHRRSNQVLALRHSYHGRSFVAVGVTGTRSWKPTGFSPLHVHYVHGGYRYRSPFGHLPDDLFVDACVDDLRNVLEVATAGDVAAFIAEPIQGVGGFITPPDGLLGRLAEVLDQHGILFISDEVQTGWGRTGEHFWGYQAHGLVPDLITFAKGIDNGLAIAGVVGRAELIDALPASSISTFGGNPLATAGALANLRYLVDHDLQQNATAMGQRLRARLDRIAAEHDIVGEVRGKGLMLGVELVQPGGKRPSTDATSALMEETKAEGLLIGRGGHYGNVLRLSPPLTVSPAEIDEGAQRLERAFANVLASH
ncbi:MAG TPA: aspartate aminotransferase family protein [Thermoanaerobaculia bacterium]|nr:aspartate aminotransferase family protein [Thermoanaerobaculia bacterium]